MLEIVSFKDLWPRSRGTWVVGSGKTAPPCFCLFSIVNLVLGIFHNTLPEKDSVCGFLVKTAQSPLVLTALLTVLPEMMVFHGFPLVPEALKTRVF